MRLLQWIKDMASGKRKPLETKDARYWLSQVALRLDRNYKQEKETLMLLKDVQTLVQTTVDGQNQAIAAINQLVAAGTSVPDAVIQPLIDSNNNLAAAVASLTPPPPAQPVVPSATPAASA